MSATYFWDGKQLITVPEQVWLENSKPYLDMPCFNTYAAPEKSGRYGYFTLTPSGSYWDTRWCPYNVNELPKEFRAHLLLLGVS